MAKQYSHAELDQAYQSLSDEQKKVLDRYVKRGMKTRWLNVWARKKGDVLSEEELEDPDKAMESLLEWVLLDYEDNLKVDPKLRCECGRPLRYRYTVLHKTTGEVYKLGKVHFEQHTGLSPEMVRLITKGLEVIDLERTEILSKVITNWCMSMSIPYDFEIPKDMAEQVRVNLPLLDRQIVRLYELIQKYSKQRDIYRYINPSHEENKTSNVKPQAQDDAPASDSLSIDYFSSIEPFHLYNRLKALRITAGEARDLYMFIKHCSPDLEDYGLTVSDIKVAARKALGYFGNVEIRMWLVEIEEL